MPRPPASQHGTGVRDAGRPSAAVSTDPRRGGLRYDVFICHAGPQKDSFAVWLWDKIQIGGRRAFLDEPDLQYADTAPAVMETALKTARVVVAVITRDFIRRKACLRELVWARDQHLQQQQQRGERPLGILPIFYRDADKDIGLGPDQLQKQAALKQDLAEYHPDVCDAERKDWLRALLFVSKQTGILQYSVGR